jgi:3-isopropylmalate/(R)-2-methylmalate dehydratase small subunit
LWIFAVGTWRIDENMKPFKHQKGIVVPLDRVNVDTDQIIPKQFLKLIERTGFGQYVFYDWRFQTTDTPNANFVLNHPRYKGGSVLLTRANFGCGSSREHAAWALLDYGFNVLIAPSYADIFYNNCFKNGILPVVLDEAAVSQLFEEVAEEDGYSVVTDLEHQTIRKPDGTDIHFNIDQFRKKCLLEGLDDISLTLQHEEEIQSHEKKLPPFQVIDVKRL